MSQPLPNTLTVYCHNETKPCPYGPCPACETGRGCVHCIKDGCRYASLSKEDEPRFHDEVMEE